MEKSPEAFRTISEAAEELNLPQHVLRFWETRFNNIQPLKRGGGRRYYRPEDVELVRTIDRLVNAEGYTLKGARQAIESGAGQATEPAAAPTHAERTAAAAMPDILPQLRAIRGRLAQALDAA